MKTILLPFFDDLVSQSTFDLAVRAVRPYNGYVECMFTIPRPPIIDGDTDAMDKAYFDRFEEEARKTGSRTRARFEACAAAQALSTTMDSDGKPATAWREVEGDEGQLVGSHGRLFDLIAVGRETGHGWINWWQIVESALFDSGRPVLLAPATPGAAMGEHVLIAWNGSTETARTVALAMPLLSRARAVTVLSIAGWGTTGPGGDELTHYLRRAGVPADVRSVTPDGRTPGVTILDECAASGADLLIKGAYTQSRLRQLIFGGATRHILEQAKIPVLLAH